MVFKLRQLATWANHPQQPVVSCLQAPQAPLCGAVKVEKVVNGTVARCLALVISVISLPRIPKKWDPYFWNSQSPHFCHGNRAERTQRPSPKARPCPQDVSVHLPAEMRAFRLEFLLLNPGDEKQPRKNRDIWGSLGVIPENHHFHHFLRCFPVDEQISRKLQRDSLDILRSLDGHLSSWVLRIT